MTRVLFLAESFHPVLGGGETHLLWLSRALASAGDAVSVVTRRGEVAWAAHEQLDGVRVARVGSPGPSRLGKYRMVPAAVIAVGREAAAHDVLVVRSPRVLGLPALVAARFAGLPVVLQPETNGEIDGTAFTWGRPWADGLAGRAVRRAAAARNVLLRDAEAFVAMSRAIREEMLRCGVQEERAHLIPHGVDVSRFAPAGPRARAALRVALGLPAGLLVVYTGRLLRGKGLDSLLAAFGPIAAERDDAHLVLVGSGAGSSLSVEEDLRRRAAEGALAGRVVFAGRVERVEDWLRAADVFAFPSQFEGLGISLVEAAACGLPAVGSRTGGIVDVIEDGRSGILVPPGDAGTLEAALRALLCDAGRRAAMGAAARQVALARFDERDALASYRALFAALAERTSRLHSPRAASAAR